MIIINYALSCVVCGRVVRFQARNTMSRVNRSGPQTGGRWNRTAADEAAPIDSAKVAEAIGMAALELAQRARAAGLTTLGFMLESVALEAGAESSAQQWPADSPDR